MLEFNEQHKSADLSSIKPKLDRAKQIGKVAICGILISATLLLSGCANIDKYTAEKITNSEITYTAIQMENGNALIIDIERSTISGNIINLTTTSGEVLIASAETTKILKCENSREIAENLAESLIAENGRITYYEDIIDLGRSR